MNEMVHLIPYNTVRVQEEGSTMCGFHCIFYLIHRCAGHDGLDPYFPQGPKVRLIIWVICFWHRPHLTHVWSGDVFSIVLISSVFITISRDEYAKGNTLFGFDMTLDRAIYVWRFISTKLWQRPSKSTVDPSSCTRTVL
jgi:hypothetical protein